MEIKHIHSNFNIFNGQLVFLVDERLLFVEVGTPNFNDYGEWNISGFRFATQKYDPSTNDVELETFINSEPIQINEKDLRFLDLTTKCGTDDGLDDEDFEFFKKEICPWESWSDELRGGVMKGNNFISIFDMNNKPVDYPTWEKTNSQHPFEKIFYPILKNFREEYISKENSKEK